VSIEVVDNGVVVATCPDLPGALRVLASRLTDDYRSVSITVDHWQINVTTQLGCVVIKR
jgi:hypothetical protein